VLSVLKTVVFSIASAQLWILHSPKKIFTEVSERTPSIQFFFGLPRALFCFAIHFNAIFGHLPSAIL
jgi:hypothetical protein